MGERHKTAAKFPSSPPRHAVYLEDGRSMRRQVNLTTSAMTSGEDSAGKAELRSHCMLDDTQLYCIPSFPC